MREVDALNLVEPGRYATDGYPHQEWSRLRAEAPVQFFDPPGWPPFWAITKHADIIEISRQPHIFLNAPGMTLVRERSDAEQDQAQSQIRTVINMDPPDHRKYRKVASPFFTPRALGGLDDLVATTSRNVVDSLGAGGECDFISDVASIYPL